MKSTNRIAASLVCLSVWASAGHASLSLVMIHISPASATMKLGDQQPFQVVGDEGNGNTLMLTDLQRSIDSGASLTPISYTCIVRADQPRRRTFISK